MKEIEKCKQYVYNNNDITQIVQEKKRFRKAPINYAMSKNELLKEIVGCRRVRRLARSCACVRRKSPRTRATSIAKVNCESN